jgi:hypothetical protein
MNLSGPASSVAAAGTRVIRELNRSHVKLASSGKPDVDATKITPSVAE